MKSVSTLNFSATSQCTPSSRQSLLFLHTPSSFSASSGKKLLIIKPNPWASRSMFQVSLQTIQEHLGLAGYPLRCTACWTCTRQTIKQVLNHGKYFLRKSYNFVGQLLWFTGTYCWVWEPIGTHWTVSTKPGRFFRFCSLIVLSAKVTTP